MIFKQINDFTLFRQRRLRLRSEIIDAFPMHEGIIVVSAAFENDRHQFRQESSFVYLTGINEPGAVLCMFPDGRDVLYAPQFGVKRSEWVKECLPSYQQPHLVGVDGIKPLGAPFAGYVATKLFNREHYGELIKDLQEAVFQSPVLFMLLDRFNDGYVSSCTLAQRCNEWIGVGSKQVDISPLVADMRRSKDLYEIDLIYKAVQITSMAHEAAAAIIKPGVTEYEVQAAAEYVFTQTAGSQPAFPTIVATGRNATILHYTQSSSILRDGELVVIDMGADYGGYAADLTRTIPVSGLFSTRQREIYEIVLEVQAYIESIAVPDMFLKNSEKMGKSLHHKAIAFLEKKGLEKYMYHGIGHYLGLDVHDVGSYATPLRSGDVFTIEPGLYFPQENIGIRIEDDYVMTDDGVVCLSSALVKQVEEIEDLMRS